MTKVKQLDKLKQSNILTGDKMEKTTRTRKSTAARVEQLMRVWTPESTVTDIAEAMGYTSPAMVYLLYKLDPLLRDSHPLRRPSAWRIGDMSKAPKKVRELFETAQAEDIKLIDLASEAGIHPVQLQHYTKGAKVPSMASFDKLSTALDVILARKREEGLKWR